MLNRLIASIHQLDQEVSFIQLAFIVKFFIRIVTNNIYSFLQPESSISSLTEISEIVRESDISPFEVIHSGLVRALLNYLTASENGSSASSLSLSAMSSFSSASPSNFGVEGASSVLGDLSYVTVNPLDNSSVESGTQSQIPSALLSKVSTVPRDKRLRNFLHVFLGCSVSI